MKQKVSFLNLRSDNMNEALSQIFNLHVNNNWPESKNWESKNKIYYDVELNGYNPDNHFSFYIDDFDEVETKIN